MTVVMPSTFAASNTSCGVGTATVVPLPSGFTKDSEARNAWPVGAARPWAASDAASGSARRTKSYGSTAVKPRDGDGRQGAVEIGLECLSDGEQLNGCEDRHRSCSLVSSATVAADEPTASERLPAKTSAWRFLS